jgi:hypothetical protein
MDEGILIGVFVATESAHAFSAFMPSYFTIKSFASDQAAVDNLRSGYPPAVIFNVALGGVVSSILKSPWPLIFGLLVSVVMIGLYERAIASVQT